MKLFEELVDWWEWYTDNRKRLTREEWVNVQANTHAAFVRLGRECEKYALRHGTKDVVFRHMEEQYNRLWELGMEMEWMTHPRNPEPAKFKETRYEKPRPVPDYR